MEIEEKSVKWKESKSKIDKKYDLKSLARTANK